MIGPVIGGTRRLPALALLSLITLSGLLSAPVHGKIRSKMHPEDLEHTFALGIDVPHLLVTTLELSAEWLAGKRWSLTGIAGVGLLEIPAERTGVDPAAAAAVTRITLGAQARKYVSGTSQMGGYLAAEALLLVDRSDQDAAQGAFAEIGIIFGYKEVWEDGFFADVGLGAAGSTAPERKRGATALEMIFNVALGYAY